MEHTDLKSKNPILAEDVVIEEAAKTIDLSRYLSSYHKPEVFIGYCKGCDRYAKSWACPPFSFDTADYFAPYSKIVIFSTKIIPEVRLNDLIRDGVYSMKEIYRIIIEEQRRRLDKILLGIEKKFDGTKACFAGNCYFCRPEDCTRKDAKPCRFPDKIRPSLEALGCDVSKTMSEVAGIELLWSNDGLLPKYYCLVSAVLLTDDVPSEVVERELMER